MVKRTDESEIKRRIYRHKVEGLADDEIIEMLNLSKEEYYRYKKEIGDEIARDYTENAAEKKAQGVIDFRYDIIENMNTWDHLVSNPKISEREKEKRIRSKKRSFEMMIRELAKMSTDYTCKDQNKELEDQSKKIILMAKEFTWRLDKEPTEQVIESWIKS
jgi:hypothetical protein